MTAPANNYNRISVQIDAIVLADRRFKDAGQKIKNYVMEGDLETRVEVQSKRLIEAQEATYALIKSCVSWKLEWQFRALDTQDDCESFYGTPAGAITRKESFKSKIGNTLRDIAKQVVSTVPVADDFVFQKIEAHMREANMILSFDIKAQYRCCNIFC